MKYSFIHPKIGLWSDLTKKELEMKKEVSVFSCSFSQKSKISYDNFDSISFEGSGLFLYSE